jgi:hypothetical protein
MNENRECHQGKQVKLGMEQVQVKLLMEQVQVKVKQGLGFEDGFEEVDNDNLNEDSGANV